METGQIIRIVMIAAGLLVLMETILSLSHRKLKEQFCLLWGVISLLLILSGIFLRPTLWSQYISETGTIIIILFALILVWCLFFFSTQISVLSRKTQELAMQVSLLNQENERLLTELEQLQEGEERGK